MENKDEYIIRDDGETYTFTKNGRVHREVGPACFSYYNPNKNEYLNLEDKDLYKFQHTQSNKKEILFESEIARMKYSNWQASRIHYFLDNREYSKEEFEKIKSSRELKNQLSTELPIAQSNNKKLKV